MRRTGPNSSAQEISIQPTCTRGTPKRRCDGSSPMARYFFDSGDPNYVVEDEIGSECTGLESARRVGIEGLKDLIREARRTSTASNCSSRCGMKAASSFCGSASASRSPPWDDHVSRLTCRGRTKHLSRTFSRREQSYRTAVEPRSCRAA